MPKPWENKSGCKDPTAYAATRPTAEEIEVTRLVKAIRSVADLFGYEIVNRIEFVSRRSGRTYR